jgi:hypothetical protein
MKSNSKASKYLMTPPALPIAGRSAIVRFIETYALVHLQYRAAMSDGGHFVCTTVQPEQRGRELPSQHETRDNLSQPG